MKEEGRDNAEREETFLSRWSRLKHEAKEQPAAAPTMPHPVGKTDLPPPELPPLEKLTLESDYRGFFHPKVDENLRRAALKKLFSDPHFNVMDGLDVYIEDYSKSDPLPAAMLAQLKQAQKILDWARQKQEATEPAAAGATDQALTGRDEKRIAPAEASVVAAAEAAPNAPGDPSAGSDASRTAG